MYIANDWVKPIFSAIIFVVLTTVGTFVSREKASKPGGRLALWGRWQYLWNILGGVVIGIFLGFLGQHPNEAVAFGILFCVLLAVSNHWRRQYLGRQRRSAVS